ncbi:MAG: oligosaccharide flippase family protein [Actinobacteria bacterium]|nr:oligosaccharide flippase family protein [Actinomycetota bacterium]
MVALARGVGGRSATEVGGLAASLVLVLILGRVAGPRILGPIVAALSTVGVAAAWRRLHRTVPPGNRRSAPAFRSLVIAARRLDVALVAAFLGLGAAGRYGAAAAVTLSAPILAAAASEAILRRTADARGGHLREAVGGFCRLLALLSVPGAVFVFVFAPEIVRALFGPGYGAAVAALRVLAVAFPVSFGNRALSASAYAMDRGSSAGLAALAALGASVAVAVVAIPTVGLAGAALGALAFELVQAGLLVIVLLRAGAAPNLGREYAPALLAGSLLAGSTIAFGRGPGGVVAGMVGALAVAVWAVDRGLLFRLEGEAA